VLIALIVLPLTALVLAFSLLIDKSYRATAQIVLVDNAGAFPSSDVETRQLATFQALSRTRTVLSRAASRLEGETVETLQQNISSAVDANANILSISATNKEPAAAAATANAVAQAFLAQQRTATETQLAADRANLERMLRRLRSTTASPAEVRAIQGRLSEIGVEEASAGSGLQLAEAAIPPARPYSPRPVRNAVFAFFAALFLAVLAALARENLVRRPAGARELGRLLQLPILAAVPAARRRRGQRLRRARGAELEAYDALAASLEFQLGVSSHDTVLIASALPGEGASEVAARLGEALADAGRATLIVDADLRRPCLHELFSLPAAPGFRDMLAAAQSSMSNGSSPLHKRVDEALAGSRVAERLAVIPAGARTSRSSLRFGRDGADARAVMAELAGRGFDYVLVVGPPLLETVEGQILARLVDTALITARLDQLTIDNIHDLRDVIERGEINALGVAAIGVQSGGTVPYYLDSRPNGDADLDALSSRS
jgi:non-specific protein-tyrosine kinase